MIIHISRNSALVEIPDGGSEVLVAGRAARPHLTPDHPLHHRHVVRCNTQNGAVSSRLWA